MAAIQVDEMDEHRIILDRSPFKKLSLLELENVQKINGAIEVPG